MFQHIGTWGDAKCIYTRGAVGSVDTAIQQLTMLRNGYWIWFFDCAGMNAMDMSFVKRIATTIKEEHTIALRHVWILNCSPWMRAILRMFGQEKVNTLDSRLETAITLQAVGCPQDVLENVTAAMSTSPVTKPARR
jgi:hypothetical protein